MVRDGSKCPVCQVTADSLGDHQVSCGGNGDRIFRHDSLREVLYSGAQAAALAPRREVPSIIPGTRRRPADIYLLHWNRGQPAALHITIISTMQQLTARGAADTQGHALMVGEERKLMAHAEACSSDGVSFIPVVAETLGDWSERAVHTLRSLGLLVGQRMGILPVDSTSNLLQSLFVCLWRGNASMWIRRIPINSAEIDSVVWIFVSCFCAC